MSIFVVNQRCMLVAGCLLSIPALSVVSLAQHVEQYCLSNKYAGTLNDIIERYVVLCVKIEKQKGCKPDFNLVRRLIFTQPCIIRCYNSMIEHKSIMPLRYLWDAYQAQTVDCTGKRFMYEFCHLIGIVFEQFIIKLVTQVAGGADADSLQDLLEKIETNLPLDELIDILEKCYAILLDALGHDQVHQQLPAIFKKRWVIAIVVGFLAINQLYKQFVSKKVLPAVVP